VCVCVCGCVCVCVCVDMYIGSKHYIRFTRWQKEKRPGRNRLFNFISFVQTHLSLYIYTYIIHEIVFLIAALLKHTRNVSGDIPTQAELYNVVLRVMLKLLM